MSTQQSPSPEGGPNPGAKDLSKFLLEEPVPILGSTLEAEKMREFVRRFAPAFTAKILLTGESGTGKDLLARHLHYRSSRRAGPFVPVNCASITTTLAESELFGHLKGAFTGADRNKRGYFELAHGGTLFLDEIAELAPSIQAKLLRGIQQSAIFRVGGEEPILVDVRIIAATHRNLEVEIAKGRFREDLYSRLRTLEFRAPALRERPGDIRELAEVFLRGAAQRHKRGGRRLLDSAVKCLMAYSWPRNIRELEQEMERVTLTGDQEDITKDELDPRISAPSMKNGSSAPAAADVDAILIALHRVDGKLEAAASTLGMHRTTLWRKMREFGISKDFKKRIMDGGPGDSESSSGLGS